MNDYDNCKCKRCGKECGRIYIARTRIGEYCINDWQCQQEGWAREGYLFTDTLPDVRTFQEKNKIK